MRLKTEKRRQTRRGLRVLTMALAVMLLCAAMPVGAATVTLSIDGVSTTIPCVMPVEGTIAVPIRQTADTILNRSAQITWNGQSAVVGTDALYLTAHPGDRYITANDRYLGSDAAVFAYYGTVYVPVRTLAKALGCSVSWDNSKKMVRLTRGSGSILNGNGYYNADHVYWLSRIISAESKGESLTGKIAVGNVIQNRVASPEFPNDIYSVIFDTKYGVQFTPVSNGTIYNTPTTQSVIAAKICLDGYSISNRALYFLDPRESKNPWAATHRSYAFTIGSHDFYN